MGKLNYIEVLFTKKFSDSGRQMLSWAESQDLVCTPFPVLRRSEALQGSSGGFIWSRLHRSPGTVLALYRGSPSQTPTPDLSAESTQQSLLFQTSEVTLTLLKSENHLRQ